MNPNTALVITSIFQPNDIMVEFAAKSKIHGIQFIVAGDTKSPDNFQLDGCDYYSVAMQENLPFAYARLSPKAHYARKNMGYLVAASNGAQIIIESDDDNMPKETFWLPKNKEELAYDITDQGWINLFSYYSDLPVWPRGFPLEFIHKTNPPLNNFQEKIIYCPIQQGLADGNPDVDAIFRLTRPLPMQFDKWHSMALGKGSWCPYNSQNTVHFKEVFPLLYLPAYCSFRMTDIWRSLVAQRICWENNWHVLFTKATVEQERNEHNLLHDFKQEIPGYLHNARICDALEQLELQPGIENLGNNMLICYQQLVDMELVEDKEIPLLQAWLKDIA